MTSLWEILVPTKYELGKQGPVSTKHHREWDKFVIRLSGGLTILKSGTIGRWVHDGKTYEDRVIPVRIACSEKNIRRIAAFTKSHYRQIQIMYYRLSNDVNFA
jgi:hypothetical protein